MRHRANPRFWACYHALPSEVRKLADRCYALLRTAFSFPNRQVLLIMLRFRPLKVEARIELFRASYSSQRGNWPR